MFGRVKGVSDTIAGLKQLRAHVKSNSKALGLFIVFNSLFGIILGAFIDNVPSCGLLNFDFSNCNLLWTVLGLFLFALYFFISFWLYSNSNPDKIEFLDRLIFKEEFDNQKMLNEVLVNGLESLNLSTCQVHECTDPCEPEQFTERLKTVLLPLYDYLAKHLQSTLSIGVYLEGFLVRLDQDQLEQRDGLFKLYDELEINGDIPDTLMEGQLKDKKGFQKYMVFNLTEVTFDENKSLIFNLNDDINARPVNISHNYFCIFSNVPDLCQFKDPECKGGIYIISNHKEDFKGDFEAFFKLYGWIVGSYIDQYNQCVSSKVATFVPSTPPPPSLKQGPSS